MQKAVVDEIDKIQAIKGEDKGRPGKELIIR